MGWHAVQGTPRWMAGSQLLNYHLENQLLNYHLNREFIVVQFKDVDKPKSRV